ncbi:YchJ family metal-binding protein [Alcaligenes faecalis]|uniref:YchJ family protein n=1 Tax=Alcaligenes faecalis TaxID=511 RepID=UPI00211B7B91|nr:YchJ family metal-binding protein [Alcaligenes faecalis]UUO12412.1 YchJ family metal-binding protein [Alcaligenes faecalis]
MKKSSSSKNSCPCGNPKTYEVCCGPWHQGPQYLRAPDAATLMRSRYSAFVRDDLDYLLATWHSSTRPHSLEPNPEGLQWLGLDVRRHERVSDTEAIVEFVARNRLNGRANRLHELSRFVLEQGQWFYVDGDFS